MMQTEGTRMTKEDRQELEYQIKTLEKELDDDSNRQRELYGQVSGTPEREKKNKELRRLRRLRK